MDCMALVKLELAKDKKSGLYKHQHLYVNTESVIALYPANYRHCPKDKKPYGVDATYIYLKGGVRFEVAGDIEDIIKVLDFEGNGGIT